MFDHLFFFSLELQDTHLEVDLRALTLYHSAPAVPPRL